MRNYGQYHTGCVHIYIYRAQYNVARCSDTNSKQTKLHSIAERIS